MLIICPYPTRTQFLWEQIFFYAFKYYFLLLNTVIILGNILQKIFSSQFLKNSKDSKNLKYVEI